MLFNISHVIKTLTVYRWFSLSYVENALFSDSDTKMVVSLLHHSISDALQRLNV